MALTYSLCDPASSCEWMFFGTSTWHEIWYTCATPNQALEQDPPAKPGCTEGESFTAAARCHAHEYPHRLVL